MAAIKLTGIVKQYRGEERPAVDEMTLQIEDGEFFVLLGPSGCGKSTLLKMIAGLEEPTRGTVEFDGTCVNYVEPGDRNVALVFQNYALYPHMSVRRNIDFPLKMRKMPKAERHAACESAAAALNLQRLLDRPVSELSGGERQRVALGRAIVRQPEVMLMDEPLSNLDALLRVQTREELLRLHRAVPSTVVYVTHDQVEAMTMADRIGIMEAGELVQVGRPKDVYRQPASRFVAGFLGSPPMGFLTGQVEERNGSVYLTGPGIKIDIGATARPPSGSALTIGLRPEHLRLTSDGSGRAGAWTVELVEALGADQLVSLTAGAARLRARVDATAEFSEGSQVGVDFALEDARFFGEDGRAVGS